MWERGGPVAFALLLALAMALLELVTSKYPRTFFLLRISPWLWAYGSAYGAIAALVTFTLGSLIEGKVITLQGFGLSNPWGQALAVGLTAKAFLHIRLFTIGAGGQSFPVGVESLVQLFEPWLLREIELEEFNAVREYVETRTNQHSNLVATRTQIKENLPQTFSPQERAAFEADLDKTATTVQALELYLRFVGRRNFDRVFPRR